MAGKRGLTMGVANDRSIAWAIARMVHAHGGQVAMTYQGETLRSGSPRSPSRSAASSCCLRVR